MQFDPPDCYMKIWLQGLNQSQDDERDYSYAPNVSNVSEFKSTAISGYVAQIVQRKPLVVFVIHLLFYKF